MTDQHFLVLNEKLDAIIEYMEKRFDAVEKVQAEHTTLLNEHTEILSEHSTILNEHTAILNNHTAQLTHIEHRQITDLNRLDNHDRRISRVEKQLISQ